MRAEKGFTIIELVIVIVLLGIISVVTVSFISSSVKGYADLNRRDQLSSAVRVAVERMSRELRNALPNSVRVDTNGNCVEFIPALAASRYISVPIGSSAAASSFQSVPFAETPVSSALSRIAVYPIDSNRADEAVGGDDVGRSASDNPIYDDDSWSIVSQNTFLTSSSMVASAGEVTVQLSGNHAFPTDSPSQRYFIVDPPISFCLETSTVAGVDLYRYQGGSYSFFQNQPSPTTFSGLGLSEPERQLLASGLVSEAEPAFRYDDSALQRNAIVLFNLLVQDQTQTAANAGTESIRVQHEVQVRNVP